MEYNIFNKKIEDYKNLWNNTKPIHIFNLPTYSKKQKKDIEKDIILTKNKIFTLLKNFPTQECDQKKWSTDLKNTTINFFSNLKIDNNHVLKYFIDEGIINSTEKFLDLSKKEDIGISQLGQALRNCWIMNILQIIFNKEIKCSKSVFAYSMLYPYTDNYIDDVNISTNDKIKYSNNLTKKLKGHNIKPKNSYENNIYRMIDIINQQYNIKDYPNIFDSLLLIHLCQTNSMNQNISNNQTYDEIMDITFKKGSSSVYVDGILLDGNLTNNEQDFTLLYGIILQLCDDLIDIREDINSNTATIFSYKYKSKTLDNDVYKLFNIINHLFINKSNFINFKNKNNVMEFIYQCLFLLAIYGIILNKKIFSMSLVKNIENYFPVNFKFIKKHRKTIKKEFIKIINKYDNSSKNKIIKYI